MADCIDLLEEFGERYRIAKDGSYYAEYGPTAWTHDPWYLQIPCRLGHIYPHGGTTLGISLDGHPIKAKQLAGLDCCRVRQHGSDGMTLLFDVADFSEVAKIVRPHRRVQLSEARKAELRANMAGVRAKRQNPCKDQQESTLICDFGGQDGSEHPSETSAA